MPAARYSFRPRHRLGGKDAFAAVFDAKVKESRGPLTIYAKPNALKHPRLGLSVSSRVGGAVKRSRIKRLLREAFRLMQHDLPAGYDFVVVVRPHEVPMLADYQRILAHVTLKLHQAWQKKTIA